MRYIFSIVILVLLCSFTSELSDRNYDYWDAGKMIKYSSIQGSTFIAIDIITDSNPDKLIDHIDNLVRSGKHDEESLIGKIKKYCIKEYIQVEDIKVNYINLGPKGGCTYILYHGDVYKVVYAAGGDNDMPKYKVANKIGNLLSQTDFYLNELGIRDSLSESARCRAYSNSITNYDWELYDFRVIALDVIDIEYD